MASLSNWKQHWSHERGWRWRRVAVLAVLGLPTLAVLGWWGGLAYSFATMSEPCRATLRETVPSPNGSSAIVIYKEKCGEGGRRQTKVSVSRNGDDFFSNRTAPFVSVVDDDKLTVRWVDNEHVIVVLSPDTYVHQADRQASGVDVDYRLKSRGPADS